VRRRGGARERRCFLLYSERGEAEVIQTHEELEVYKMAFHAAMRIFEISKGFPSEEKYSLTDQIRRSSLRALRPSRPEARSVCSNIAEAWSLSEPEAL